MTGRPRNVNAERVLLLSGAENHPKKPAEVAQSRHA